MNQPVIEVNGLSKTYRDGFLGRRAFQALKGVDLTVHSGEVFGLLGPNGAGKTTMVKILLGICRKSGGSARLLGFEAGDLRSRRDIGYLPENLLIPRHHNANTALDLYGKLSGMSTGYIRQRRQGLLELVGLSSRAGDSVAKYSKGMLQRLGLAQALLHDPRVVFLDEPTDGLDPVGRREVREILVKLSQEGKTVFLNSHLLQEVEMICNRVAILDQGEVVRVGSVAELNVLDQDGIDLALELIGERERIMSILGLHDLQLESVGENQFHAQKRVRDQAEQDRLVDELRRQAISLISMTPKRGSLEEVFLKVVQ